MREIYIGRVVVFSERNDGSFAAGCHPTENGLAVTKISGVERVIQD